MKKVTLWLLFLLMASVLGGHGHSVSDAGSSKEERPYIKLTLYPTASLSRYDYNLDLDLYEIRVYAEFRQGCATGPLLPSVLAWADGHKLAADGELYTVKYPVDRHALPQQVKVRIKPLGEEGLTIEETLGLPAWLVLTAPRPQLLEAGKDLVVSWDFSPHGGAVDLRAYNFKDGKPRYDLQEQHLSKAVVPGGIIHSTGIIRVLVTPTWMFKRYFANDALAQGLEVNVIPWSQVFLRSRDAASSAGD
jgi:hypothetical protein